VDNLNKIIMAYSKPKPKTKPKTKPKY